MTAQTSLWNWSKHARNCTGLNFPRLIQGGKLTSDSTRWWKWSTSFSNVEIESVARLFSRAVRSIRYSQWCWPIHRCFDFKHGFVAVLLLKMVWLTWTQIIFKIYRHTCESMQEITLRNIFQNIAYGDRGSTHITFTSHVNSIILVIKIACFPMCI